MQSIPPSGQDDTYQEASAAYAAALSRLARAYEAEPEKRRDLLLVGLEELVDVPGTPDSLQAVAEHQALARLTELIRQLIPIDRQVILSYLEGMDADAISELTGLSAAHVATKVHRIKEVLRKRFEERDSDER